MAVFNPQINTQLSTPQMGGATGAVQVAAPSGAAIGMSNFANLFEGISNSWIDYRKDAAAAAKANEPSYGERNDQLAMEVLNDPEYARITSMVPQNAAGAAQLEEAKREFLHKVSITHGPSVLDKVASTMGITTGASQSMAERSLAAARTTMASPEYADLALAATVRDADGNYDEAETIENFERLLADHRALDREAKDAANRLSINKSDQEGKEVVWKQFIQDVEPRLTKTVNDTVANSVDVWLKAPGVTLDEALAGLRETRLIASQRAVGLYAEAGVPESFYRETLASTLKPIDDVISLIESNIADEATTRAALAAAREQGQIDALAETLGPIVYLESFTKAVLENAAASEGMVGTVSSVLNLYDKNGEGKNIPEFVIDGMGRSRAVGDMVETERARVSAGGEPLATNRATTAIVSNFTDTVKSLVGSGELPIEDSKFLTANLAIAVDNRVLSLEVAGGGKSPLGSVYNSDTMRAFELFAGGSDPGQAQVAQEFVNVGIRQVELNKVAIDRAINNAGLDVDIIRGEDGSFVLVNKGEDPRTRPATVPEEGTGIISHLTERAGAKVEDWIGRTFDPQARALDTIEAAIARINFIESSFAGSEKLNELFQSGGKISGTTPAQADREAGMAPPEKPDYNLGAKMGANIDATMLDWAVEVNNEAAAENGVPADPAEVNAAVADAVSSAPAGRTVSEDGLGFVMSQEGLSLSAYPDAGRFAIGYGHTRTASDGMSITEDQAKELLVRDMADVEQTINSAVTVQLSQGMYDALGSFIYNVGGGAFRDSTLLKKLNAGDYEGAAREFLRWNKSEGKVLAGLTKRRQMEMEMFLSSLPEDAIQTTKLDGDTTPVGANEGNQGTTTGPAPQLVDVDFANSNGVPMTRGQVRVFSTRKEAEQAAQLGQIKRGDRVLVLENGEQVILEVE